MGFIRKILSVAAVLVAAVGIARAQNGVVWSTAADSLAAAGQAVPDSLLRGFNALDYSMQRRFRPADEDFTKAYSLLTVGGAADLLKDSGLESFSLVRGAYLDFGRRVHKYNAWRLGLGAGQLFRNSDYRSFYRAGLSFEHNFFFGSYLGGYRNMRPFDVYSVLGLGADAFLGSDTAGGTFGEVGSVTVAPYVRIGLGFQFRFCDRASLLMSPQYAFYPMQFVVMDKGVGDAGSRKYDSGFNMRVGVQFDLGKDSESVREDGMTFVSAQGGVQFQNGFAMWNSSSFNDALRESVSLSVGRWNEPYLAARGSFYHGRDVWKTLDADVVSGSVAGLGYRSGYDSGSGLGSGSCFDRKMLCGYDALRLEAMFDPFGLGKAERWDVHFSTPLIIGMEAGLMNKRDCSVDIKRFYMGLSTGFQLRYDFSLSSSDRRSGGRFGNRMGIFLEPHCSVVPYCFNDVVDGRLVPGGKNYWDAVISLSLGVEISL